MGGNGHSLGKLPSIVTEKEYRLKKQNEPPDMVLMIIMGRQESLILLMNISLISPYY